MMTRNIIYTTIKSLGLACLMLAFASCSEEFFDVEVGERITENKHYSDEIDIMASFNGTLIALQDVAANSILADGLRSDQMVLTSNANADLFEIGNLNMRADNPILDKSGYYRTIINVNEVLAHIQEVADRDPREFLSGETFDMRATLYGLRAWCYLNVVRNYGEVNWIDKNLRELPDDVNGNKLNKADLLESLINSFYTDSIIFNIFTGDKSRIENTYPSFPNYKAVLGELYLEQEKYDSAAYYLQLGMETIPSGESSRNYYKVNADFGQFSWGNIFVNAESKSSENICVIPYNLSEGQPNPIVQYFLPSALYMVKAAQHLVDSFNTAEPLGNSIFNYDAYRGVGVSFDYLSFDSVFVDSGLHVVNGIHYINKYSIGTSDAYSSDVILQRAADVHLLLAEALNRNGRSDVALMLLNSGIFGAEISSRPRDFNTWTDNRGIRGRARLAAREVPDSIADESGSLRVFDGIERVEMIEDYILQEKAMECAFEGKRMSDIIRVAQRRDNPEEYLSSVLMRKYSDPAKQAAVKSYYMNKANWYLPN